jgi:hypothetical protein
MDTRVKPIIEAIITALEKEGDAPLKNEEKSKIVSSVVHALPVYDLILDTVVADVTHRVLQVLLHYRRG